MKIDEKKFNRWFNVFILAGMTAALLIITIFKLGGTETGKALLLISAFGSLMGVLSTVCSANGSILTFLFGFLDVSIYGAMCLVNWRHGSSGLGNAILHFVYFVPMQFVGFFQWRKRGAGKHGAKVEARRLNGKQWLYCSLFFVAFSVIAYLVLARFDKSAADSFIKVAVVLDVLPLVCNILGQFLMSTAYMDQWIFWIGVNITSVLMWVNSYNTSADTYTLVYIIKYSFYLINSFNGLRIWLKLSRKEDLPQVD